MALRVLKEGETADVVAAKAELLNNFNPQNVVRFADEALDAADCSIMSSEEFQSFRRTEKQTAKPVLINRRGSATAERALAIDGKFVLINPFAADVAQAQFPMFSPHGNHIYLDMTDYQLAYNHRHYREMLSHF